MAVSTVVKDSFFDDPFFSDWWKDFDAPIQQTYDKTFQRQISSKSSGLEGQGREGGREEEGRHLQQADETMRRLPSQTVI